MPTAVHVVGARPNFPKLAPVWSAMAAHGGFRQVFVHTGQHYDEAMSQVFLAAFGLPNPDYELGVGSGSHAVQTAAVMTAIEPVLVHEQPDVVCVYGDVNSTVAAALVASKLHLRVAHVEAGLRSGDRAMPEEINRIVTDVLSDWLFVPSEDGVDNLRAEGLSGDKIHLVGNVMIDTLAKFEPQIRASHAHRELHLPESGFVVATLHRPSNVDDIGALETCMAVLRDLAKEAPTVLVAHPRTQASLRQHEVDVGSVQVEDPLGYIDFLGLVARAGAVLTDSGGLQEETTWLGVPCVTMRTTTERPVTVTMGTNTVVGTDSVAATETIRRGLRTTHQSRTVPLWDGRAAERIVEALASGIG